MFVIEGRRIGGLPVRIAEASDFTSANALFAAIVASQVPGRFATVHLYDGDWNLVARVDYGGVAV